METVSRAELQTLINPFLDKPVSRAWQGHGSALFLEIGELTDDRGEMTVMIEWSWRVEKGKSIWFGSWSEDALMETSIPELSGKILKDITVFGRLPELTVQFSEGIWIHSFATVEGQPEWALICLRVMLNQ